MIPEHGQTGPALPEHVDGVDRHDDAAARHQDADPAVAEANGVVGHPEEDHGLEETTFDLRNLTRSSLP